MNAIAPLPIEIDPRPCGWCGLTIDRHQMVDEGEGPFFFCRDLPVDELTLAELERRAELRREEEVAAMVRDWEMDDLRDRWRHTGETQPSEAVRNSDLNAKPDIATRSYSTPQSTIDEFFCIASTQNADGIVDWLALHPRDAQHLHQLWKQKCPTAPAK